MNGILAPLATLGGTTFYVTLGLVGFVIWGFVSYPQEAWGGWWWVACVVAIAAILMAGGWLLWRIVRWTTK